MKKIITIVFPVLMLIGCSEDFLNRYPTTYQVIESFYKTPSDGKQALTAAYNILVYDDYWSNYIMSEIMSDNCAGGAGSTDAGNHFQLWDRAIPWPDATANQEAWQYYFGGIYRANTYLEYEKFIDWNGNENLRLQYQAEARFLRAHYHFYLARMFGTIPALDHTITPDEIPERTPAEDLYDLIISDFKFCAENGLSAPYGSMDPENWGRATKWAAEAMIARVYLFYSGYFNDPDIKGLTAADALGYIDDVINNSGHALVPEFASLWRVPTLSELGGDTSLNQYAGEENSEVLWAVRFDPSGNQFQWLQRMIGPRNVNIDPYGQGWGAMPVLPTFWNAFEAGDKRKTASILSWDDEGLVYDYVSQTQAQYTGYNVKKYDIVSVNGRPEAQPNWQIDCFEDYILMRYADVLLMGAELHLLNGDAATAVTLTNRVRERAFGDITHNYSTVTIDDIIRERRFELAFEGLRYWDILRMCKGDFSKLIPILTYVDPNDDGDQSQTADPFSLDVDGNNFAQKKGLCQIPDNELDLMRGVIKQNEGYTGD
ncbi:MAG: RagB/SusD family nutrient uptake outer membrane protein [Bacteroidales bacterium]|nr:RagB/SusD family nutrient uptake outer membrane protein [Bacteroidales bacterium]